MGKRLILLVVVLSIFSCNSDIVYSEYNTLSEPWSKDQVISFDFSPVDTISKHNLYVHIRNNNEYEFSNLYLIVKMNFPEGKVLADTLQYKMAYPDGKWMGTGFTDYKENKLFYKEGVTFNQAGNYKMEISHAMRKNGEIPGIENLKGITDIGFSIEKFSKN
jgi:gliding motility-associated lipoprotein GldH